MGTRARLPPRRAARHRTASRIGARTADVLSQHQPRRLQRSALRIRIHLAALETCGIAQANIVIEITERVSIVDYERFEAAIRHYASQGFSIALDDFGSGHSGLVTLISLASNVGAVLIAEGVETWGELTALRHYGVEWGQGFLFGRPAASPRALESSVSERLRNLREGFTPNSPASARRSAS